MVFSQFFSLLMPALLITMSRRPNVSTVRWNASVRQKQRGISERLQELERHRTLSRKLRKSASLCHFEKKKGEKVNQNPVRTELSTGGAPNTLRQCSVGQAHRGRLQRTCMYLQTVSIHLLLKRCISKPNDVKTLIFK